MVNNACLIMVNNGDAFQDELDVMYERVTFAGSYANKVDFNIFRHNNNIYLAVRYNRLGRITK